VILFSLKIGFTNAGFARICMVLNNTHSAGAEGQETPRAVGLFLYRQRPKNKSRINHAKRPI